MTRATACVVFLVIVLSTQVIAAEIGGYVNVKADVDRKSLLVVAYGRYHPRYTQSTIYGNCRYGGGNIKSEQDV